MADKSKLIIDKLEKLRSRLNVAVKIAVTATAIQIASDAAENAAKDTEFLAESIYVSSTEFSSYGSSYESSNAKFNAAKAIGRTPKGVRLGPNSQYGFFPEIKPTDPREVWVVVGAYHGIFNEKGIQGRKPFLTPAVYANRTTLTDNVRKSIDGLSVKSKVTVKDNA